MNLKYFSIPNTQIEFGLPQIAVEKHKIELDFNEIIGNNSPEIELNLKNNNRKYSISGKKDNIVTKIGNNNSWIGCIYDNELEKSKESIWKIKILKSKHNFIMVGVAPIDFDINSSILLWLVSFLL